MLAASMLAALGSLATQQANPTQNTMEKVKQLLDYAATHPDAIVTYNASDMVLAAHSNASYLSESNVQSRASGHFFHVKRGRHATQQWRSDDHFTNNQGLKPKSEHYSSTAEKQYLQDTS
jgi:hypothetical protein